MRILIIEDEYVSRTKLKSLLRDRGDVDAVPDGEIALRMVVRAHDEMVPYDLITVDVNLPDMSGREVVRRIRAWEEEHGEITGNHQANVLMITMVDNPKEVMSSFSEGAQWYLVKPVTPEKLDKALKEIQSANAMAKPSHTPQPTRTPAPKPAVKPAAAATSTATPSVAAANGVCLRCGKLTLPAPTKICLKDLQGEFLDDYLDSTRQKLFELEEAALKLEDGDDPEAQSQSIMRTMHSLKGEAGMIGLLDVQAVCHDAETYFKEEGGTAEAADFIFKIKDWLAAAVTYVEDPQADISVASDAASADAQPAEPAPEPIGPAVPSLPEPSAIRLDAVKDYFLQEYIESSRARLDELEQAALSLESGNSTGNAAVAVLLSLNALKGESTMIGLDDLRCIIQQFEDVLRASSNDPAAAGAVLKLKDWLEDFLTSLPDRMPTHT